MIARPHHVPIGFDEACRVIQPCLCYFTLEVDSVEPPVLATGCLLAESIAMTSLSAIKTPMVVGRGKPCLRAEGRRFSFKIAFVDDDRDLALVRLGAWGKQGVEHGISRFPRLGRHIPDLGLSVGMLAYDSELDHPMRRDTLAATFHTASISWWMGNPPVRMAISSGTTVPSARGGPVFLPTGEIIGIMSRHPHFDQPADGVPMNKSMSLPMISALFERIGEMQFLIGQDRN